MKLSEISKALGLAANATEGQVREGLAKFQAAMDRFSKVEAEMANEKAASKTSADRAEKAEAALSAEQAARKTAEEKAQTLAVANEKLAQAVVGEALRDGKILLAEKENAVKQILAGEDGYADKLLRGQARIHTANAQISATAATRQGREEIEDNVVNRAHMMINERAIKDGITYEQAYYRMRSEKALPFRDKN